jgi:hypothetical protein
MVCFLIERSQYLDSVLVDCGGKCRASEITRHAMGFGVRTIIWIVLCMAKQQGSQRSCVVDMSQPVLLLPRDVGVLNFGVSALGNSKIVRAVT